MDGESLRKVAHSKRSSSQFWEYDLHLIVVDKGIYISYLCKRKSPYIVEKRVASGELET